MPLRRDPGPPDLARVAAVLGGRPPGRSAAGWVPDAPPETSQVALLEEVLVPDEIGQTVALRTVGPGSREHRVPDRAATVGEAEAGLALESVAEELDRLDADLRAARRPAILTVPEPLRSGRLAVSSSAVVALLALVVAVACVFALRVLWAERSAGAVEAPAPRGGSGVSVQALGSGSATATRTGQVSGATPTPTAQVVVHVVGQVKRPGLVRLGSGARVADAIERAGGATRAADLSTLNLARVVVDGEQVRVPRPGEVPPPAPGGGVTGSATGTGLGPDGSGGTLVNLNTADLSALDTLPGVGPVLAQRIIDWRTEHGRFTSVEELGEVSGIGEKLYAQIRPKVTV